jgi:hypothetical protein
MHKKNKEELWICLIKRDKVFRGAASSKERRRLPRQARQADPSGLVRQNHQAKKLQLIQQTLKQQLLLEFAGETAEVGAS